MFLTVEKYNSEEKEGRKHLPNRFMEAFKPITFERLGYPARIESEDEVYKFFDSMHDGRLRVSYGGGYSV